MNEEQIRESKNRKSNSLSTSIRFYLKSLKKLREEITMYSDKELGRGSVSEQRACEVVEKHYRAELQPLIDKLDKTVAEYQAHKGKK